MADKAYVGARLAAAVWDYWFLKTKSKPICVQQAKQSQSVVDSEVLSDEFK